MHRVPRPAARYRPGKAPANAVASDDESDDEVHEAPPDVHAAAQAQAPPPMRGIDLDEYETDSAEEEHAQREQPPPGMEEHAQREQPRPGMAPAAMAPARAEEPAPAAAAQPAAATRPAAPASPSPTESSYESSSDEAPAPPPLLKPVFVPRAQRTTHGRQEAERAREAEAAAARAAAAARKQASHDMAAEHVRQEIRAAQKEREHVEIDDTDGVDPDAEFAAWRARELVRIRRVQDAEAAAAAEREAVARRRALPEAQRLAEDMAHAAETRRRKPRGHQGFMQKYYHKGAFFQDMEILQRDFTEQSADAVDKTQLPRIMQVRDFGKRSRSKWTHLAAEDTSKDDLRAHGARQR